MDQPLVSIIMPAYNAEKYIAESVKSIVQQSYQNWELIVIDDGSNDGTVAEIKKINNSKISLFEAENKGQSAQLNMGISNGNGEYIAIAHADDINLKERLKLQVDFMETNPEIGICGSYIEMFNSSKEVTSLTTFPLDPDSCYSGLYFANPLAHPSVIIRKSIVDKYRLKYDETQLAAEDYNFWIRLSKFTKISNIPQILVRYRLHRNQTSIVKTIEEKIIVNRSRLLLVFQLCEGESRKNTAITYNFFYRNRNLKTIKHWKAIMLIYKLILIKQYMTPDNAKLFLIGILKRNLKSLPYFSRAIHIFFSPILIILFGYKHFRNTFNELFLTRAK